MRAAYFETHGPTENIKVGDLSQPEPTEDEVLVKTSFGGLNHLDLFVLQGWPGLNLKLPHIMGSDGSGIVEAVGEKVQGIKIGDRVTINPGYSCNQCALCLAGKQNLCKSYSIKGEHRSGTYAEYFTIQKESVIQVPESISMKEAAAAPLVFLTAWRLLVTKGQIKPGDYVLIQGAGGGVATAAIQIAKLFNATVIATTSTEEKMKKATEIGADHVINYKETPDYGKIIYKEMTNKHGIDIALDSVGQATFKKSLRTLAPQGRLVTPGATTGGKVEIDLRAIFWKQIEILGSTMSNQSEFRQVMAQVFNGTLKPVVDRVFPLEEARDALEYLERGEQFGKVLLQP